MKTTEHRKISRKSCFVPIDGKESSVFSDIHSVDISCGGLGFVSRSPVPLNKRIAVEVELGPGQDPVLMLGEVRWVKPVKYTENYRIGMKFIKVLFSGSRSRLTKYFGG